MSATRSTASKEARKTASGVSDFKKRKEGSVIPLPSGLQIRARRVDLTSLLKQGDVPNALVPIVQQALAKGQQMDPKDLVGDQVDMSTLTSMLEMVDSVVVSTCVEPQVHPDPEAGVEEEDDLLYVKDLEADDKMFIFQWALGGTEDIATFRAEAQADLAALGKS